MSSFGDLDTASKFVSAIERIATSIVDKIRPEPIVGKVYRIDQTQQKAYILRPGETVGNLLVARYSLDKKPWNTMELSFASMGYDAPGDIVRLASSSFESYFILDFIYGRPEPLILADANIHKNGSFDQLDVFGKPAFWNNFWGTGTRSVVMDSTEKLQGNYSVKVAFAASSSSVFQTNVFDVKGGNILAFSFFARGTGSFPKVDVCIQSSAISSNPDYFDSNTINATVQRSQLDGDWRKYTAQFTVPSGHSRARVSLECGGVTSGAGVVNLDKTELSINTAINDSGWTAFPGSGGIVAYGGGWQDPQYRKINTKVELRGLLSVPTVAANAVIGTMPVGFRPPGNLLGPWNTGLGAQRWNMLTTGALQTEPALSSPGYISLNGVSWFTD